MSLPRIPALGTTDIRQRDINASVGNLRLDSGIVSVDIRPSIGMLARDIDRLGIDIRSFREPLERAIKQVMIPSIAKNFDEEGRPQKWDPLQPYTIKMRGGQTGPILNRTGTLSKAAVQFSNWNISQIAAVFQGLPNRAKYGDVHQGGYGGDASVVMKQSARKIIAGAKSAGKFAIPARPFVMYQEEDEFDIEEIFAEWLEERAARVGRMV